jgi:hypothetical protein
MSTMLDAVFMMLARLPESILVLCPPLFLLVACWLIIVLSLHTEDE